MFILLRIVYERCYHIGLRTIDPMPTWAVLVEAVELFDPSVARKIIDTAKSTSPRGKMSLFVWVYVPRWKGMRLRTFNCGNMRFLHEKARVLLHSTAQNHSFPVRSMSESTWSCSDSARIRTFGR